MERTVKTAVFTVIILIGLFTAFKTHLQRETNLTAEVVMTVWQSGSVSLYADTGEGFHEKLSARRFYAGDGSPHRYILPLQVFRDIKTLYLFPIEGKGMVELSRITIIWQGKVYRFAGEDLNQWHLQNSLIKKGETRDGGILLEASSPRSHMLLTFSHNYSLTWEIFSFLRNKTPLLIWVFFFALLGLKEQSWTLSGERKDRKDLFFHLFAGGMPLILLWILYHETLNTWWLIDDPCHLFYVSQNGLFTAFYDPARTFSPINFTPMLPFSFGLDYFLFGLNPEPFYWHHLLSFTATLIAGYILFGYFFPPLISCIILSSFISSLPFCDATFHLMVRHYIEGLFFSFISLILFLAAIREGKNAYYYTSALFYLLACISKEVYVPLIALFAVLLLTKEKLSLKVLYPYITVFVLYFLWRFYMLGIEGMASAYPHIPVRLENVLNAPLIFASMMDWINPWHLLLIAIPAFLFFITFVLRSWHYKLTTLTLIICTIVPIIPVLGMFSSRYVFVLSLIIFMGMGIGILYLYTLTGKTRLRHFLALILGISITMVGLPSTEKGIEKWKQYSENIRMEGNFLLHENNPATLLITEHGHCYWAFSALRKSILNLPQGASFCKSDCVCPFLHPDKKMWVHVDGQLFRIKTPVEITTPEVCGGKGDLNVNIHYSHGTLKWKFGPHREGRYLIFIKGWDSGLIQVKSAAELPYSINLKEDFIIVKYESPQGWSVYSPVLTFQKQGNNEGSILWMITSSSSSMNSI